MDKLLYHLGMSHNLVKYAAISQPQLGFFGSPPGRSPISHLANTLTLSAKLVHRYSCPWQNHCLFRAITLVLTGFNQKNRRNRRNRRIFSVNPYWTCELWSSSSITFSEICLRCRTEPDHDWDPNQAMYTINSKDIFRTPTSVLTIPGLTNPMANVTPNPSQSAQSIIVNVEESTKQDGVLDLVKPFDLQRIKIESVRIASGKTNQFIVHPTTNHFIYIIKGEGILYTRYGEGVAKDGQALRKDDCFSFPSQADKVEYSIEAKDQEVLVITFADPEGSERPVTVSFCPLSPVPLVVTIVPQRTRESHEAYVC